MLTYRMECQEDDGSWTLHNFQTEDDADAISYGLLYRTANRCELYRAECWLATFDGAIETEGAQDANANDNTLRKFGVTGIEQAYCQRRALREREASRTSKSITAKRAHLCMAEQFEILARVLQAERRRLEFYDVNAIGGQGLQGHRVLGDRCSGAQSRQVRARSSPSRIDVPANCLGVLTNSGETQ